MQNIYESTDRVVTITKEFMMLIFPVFDERNKNNYIFIECATELLHSLCRANKNELINELRKTIIEYYMKTVYCLLEK